jgi:hypothetical protein
MSDQEGDDDQIKRRMDAMLLRLLKTPPQSRADLAEAVRRAKGKKPTRTRTKRASGSAKAPRAGKVSGNRPLAGTNDHRPWVECLSFNVTGRFQQILWFEHLPSEMSEHSDAANAA